MTGGSKPHSAPASAARVESLNGLRGWAALSVVVFHMTWETFGVVFPPFRNPVTAFFLDGPLAVSIFFVLSGEALSTSFFSGGGDVAVIRLAVKRYSRLTLPIAACCLLTYVLCRAGLVYNVQAGQIVHRMDWLGAWLDPEPNLKSAVKYALWKVFTNVPAARALNPFLWTMRVEMLGSMLVFWVLLLFSKIRHVWPLVAAIFAYDLFRVLNGADNDFGYWCCFLAGLTFAALRSRGFFARAQSSGYVIVGSGLLVAFMAILDGICHWKEVGRQYTVLVAIVMVAAVYCNPWLCARFTSTFSRFLGKLSFSLYLVQFPMLVSVTSYAIYVEGRNGLSPAWIWGIALASIGGTVAVAYAFESVERLTRFVGERITAFMVIPDDTCRRHQRRASGT
jgi:peptidoglycan/LPS O-acetylase OafA/YrhL